MSSFHLYVSLEKCVFRSSAHCFNGLFCFLDIELYDLFVYLEIIPLSVASFENIFSHPNSCLFILHVISFAVQKLLSLIRVS